jgi:DNA polymerase III epsilon subunit-like protein
MMDASVEMPVLETMLDKFDSRVKFVSVISIRYKSKELFPDLPKHDLSVLKDVLGIEH